MSRPLAKKFLYREFEVFAVYQVGSTFRMFCCHILSVTISTSWGFVCRQLLQYGITSTWFARKFDTSQKSCSMSSSKVSALPDTAVILKTQWYRARITNHCLYKTRLMCLHSEIPGLKLGQITYYSEIGNVLCSHLRVGMFSTCGLWLSRSTFLAIQHSDCGAWLIRALETASYLNTN